MSVRILIYIIYCSLITISLKAQIDTVLVFDLSAGHVDSMIVDFSEVDTTLIQDATKHFIGTFNESIELLEVDYQIADLATPLANSTARRKVNLDYDLNKFPIRTSVKTSYYENDTIKDLCSGSIISKRHILTSAHCHLYRDSNDLFFDSILVCPVYDNALPNTNFPCHLVSKVYALKDWNPYGEDFVVLEMEENIGLSTGWLGIGYDDDDDSIEEKLYYKFAYPADSLPGLDSIGYNGDTLYYRYGEAKVYKFSGNNFIGFAHNVALPGESGSSIVMVDNSESYISYGVLTFATHSFHNRITNRIFHVLKSIIGEEIDTSVDNLVSESPFDVYPNPTSGEIKLDSKEKIDWIELYDWSGQLVTRLNGTRPFLDLSFMSNGIYILKICNDEGVTYEKKLLKVD